MHHARCPPKRMAASQIISIDRFVEKRRDSWRRFCSPVSLYSPLASHNSASQASLPSTISPPDSEVSNSQLCVQAPSENSLALRSQLVLTLILLAVIDWTLPITRSWISLTKTPQTNDDFPQETAWFHFVRKFDFANQINCKSHRA